MSRIEQIIGEIEEYIDGCKYQPLSNTKIVVNKEELEELMVELRLRVPEEIKKYQKIISNEEAILAEARAKADEMIAAANKQVDEIVNEHEIVKRAQEEGQKVKDEAARQAQAMMESAAADADNIRQSAIDYTDDMLYGLQTIIKHSLEESGGFFASMQNSLQNSYEIITSNRNELAGSVTTVPEDEQ